MKVRENVRSVIGLLSQLKAMPVKEPGLVVEELHAWPHRRIHSFFKMELYSVLWLTTGAQILQEILVKMLAMNYCKSISIYIQF